MVAIAATSELIIDNVQVVFFLVLEQLSCMVQGVMLDQQSGVGSAICGNGGSVGANIPTGTIISVTDGLRMT